MEIRFKITRKREGPSFFFLCTPSRKYSPYATLAMSYDLNSF